MNSPHPYRLILQMLLLSALSAASVLLCQHGLYFCLLSTAVLLILLMARICHTQRQSHRLIQRIVESLRYNDFAPVFSTRQKDTPEDRLRQEVNTAMKNFRTQLAEQQERNRFNETLFDTVDCSLLIADREHHIRWMNRCAVQELVGHPIHSISELDVLNKELPQQIRELRPGEVKILRLYKEDLIHEMAATVTVYTTPKDHLRLIHLKNLRFLLEENETEAWQKLIRVLTHEIMNSITPILSLSDTLCDRLAGSGRNGHDEEMILQGMKTIRRRSEGLLEFVRNYRKLSRLSSPLPAPVRIGDLLEDLRKLYPNQTVHYHYQIEDEDHTLMLDRPQMEQVLINLLKNATEACEGTPRPEVHITSRYQEEKKLFQLTVADNGCGILPEVLDKIFVPFFTTKPKGSGIGLSLCKQIMARHGGSITVNSEAGKGTSFTLHFPQSVRPAPTPA